MLKDPLTKRYKRNYTIHTFHDAEGALCLVKFHDIHTGKGEKHERCNNEELLTLPEQTWNALPNDHLNFRKTLQSDKVVLKFPQTREDLRQMRFSDLKQWIQIFRRGKCVKEYEKGGSTGSRLKGMRCCRKRHYKQNSE